jgi:hypothetical protein
MAQGASIELERKLSVVTDYEVSSAESQDLALEPCPKPSDRSNKFYSVLYT